MFAALGIFGGLGLLSAVAADVGRRNRGWIAAMAVYAELYLPSAALVMSAMTGWYLIGNRAVGRVDDLLLLLGMGCFLLMILIGLAVAGVAGGWRGTWRVLAYTAWAILAFAAWSAGDAAKPVNDVWRSIQF
jgi:hypothetical protein